MAGAGPELVERRRAQLADQRAQALDLARRSARRPPLERARASPRRPSRRRAADSSIRRPPSPCSVSSCSSRAQRARSASAAASESRSRCVSTERAVATAVAALAANACSRRSSSASKARGAAAPVEGDEHAERAAAEDERHQQRGARLQARARPRRRAAASSGAPCSSREPPSRGRRRDLAGGRGDHQPVVLAQQDHDAARVDQRPPALDDQLEHPVEVDLAADGAGDRRGRLEPAHRPLELVAARLGRPVEPRVLDRDRRPVGEDARRPPRRPR